MIMPLSYQLMKDAGQITAVAGKKLIKASIFAGKVASRLTFTFIKGGVEALRDAEGSKGTGAKIETLSSPLSIVDNGLSVPASFVESQMIKIQTEITDDLTILKGQNEILFLSNSIRYFVESHIGRTGIDRGISHALQYDMKAVTNYLKDNSGIRFPGYLLHQSTSLCNTIKEMNIFYDAILHGGHVKDWTEEEVQAELQKFFGVEGNKKYIQNYMPFELQIPIKRRLITEAESKKSKFGALFSSTMEEVNDAAHDALFVLANELVANENLEYEVTKKLEREPNREIFIEAPALAA
ncbi:hypothetical protein G3480_25045 [Thiorhodococcus mannitoliphagus]|uniref:Uncharacterized protein n=1 Tax=Thiorhodococcus mannitoliphagus TaxID=329406 RepID=A0A6P1DZ48_9GAMM|nr:hypothetical protein [Thiorhodococcus mannitoliphagus]NEX23508.1 hypothetical protein [Thiorhodococcus mannitoliphagus]